MNNWKKSVRKLKFRFSKKATKFETISHEIWRYLVNVKSSGRLFQIFVAFSECPNFNWQTRKTRLWRQFSSWHNSEVQIEKFLIPIIPMVEAISWSNCGKLFSLEKVLEKWPWRLESRKSLYNKKCKWILWKQDFPQVIFPLNCLMQNAQATARRKNCNWWTTALLTEFAMGLDYLWIFFVLLVRKSFSPLQ